MITVFLSVCHDAGTSVLQVPVVGRRTVPAPLEAELQESSALHHLPGSNWGRVEGAGRPHTEGTLHLTGEQTHDQGRWLICFWSEHEGVVMN